MKPKRIAFLTSTRPVRDENHNPQKEVIDLLLKKFDLVIVASTARKELFDRLFGYVRNPKLFLYSFDHFLTKLADKRGGTPIALIGPEVWKKWIAILDQHKIRYDRNYQVIYHGKGYTRPEEQIKDCVNDDRVVWIGEENVRFSC